MARVIMVESFFKRLAEAGVTVVPKKYYDITNDGEYKVGVDSNDKVVEIHFKSQLKDEPEKSQFMHIASFYTAGSWTAVPVDDEWAGKFVKLLEDVHAILVGESKDEA